ncbi:MAG TPA: SAM-dependent chlorinase/fluorinase [Candidatus Kapabacteria bacterium]|nr:SAM-dependent chlorinase/fluorinase [Candidatus Kapabacteria bacterium]
MTDFGNSSYVGQVKGIISKICHNSNIIDLTHNIEKYNIIEAAFVLYNSITYFPNNSIFVCIVAPGVGTDRKPIIIKSETYYFVGPDNGIFTLILDNLNIDKVIILQNQEYFHNTISNTFHGRDIFAPSAAYLSNGVDIDKFGIETSANNLVRNTSFYPQIFEKYIIGNILFADSYGNLISNIHSSYLSHKNFKINFMSYEFTKLYNNFADVEIGQALAFIGSSGHLELAINQGNFSNLASKNSTIQIHIL